MNIIISLLFFAAVLLGAPRAHAQPNCTWTGYTWECHPGWGMHGDREWREHEWRRHEWRERARHEEWCAYHYCGHGE